MRTSVAMLCALLVACDDKGETDTAPEVVSVDTVDADADGYSIEDGDCNDGDASISPAGIELCDGIDNNCDGEVDEDVTSIFYADSDEDGFGNPLSTTEACTVPTGYVGIGNDCDDSDAESYPGASERCDGVDNDCDGAVDEDVTTTWHADADADGYGDPDAVLEDCDPPAGYTTDDNDCNDLNATANPAAKEVCDEVDNDCDGDVDEDVTNTYYQDVDADGYGLSDVTTTACDQPTGYASRGGDCNDGSDEISPIQIELCDGIDNDCNGYTDEDTAADATVWYQDTDGDSYGLTSSTVVSCDQPTGYVDVAGDCDDGEGTANPGETEVCDSIDNDCDGDTDEDAAADASTWYADHDGDGYGGTSSTVACAQPSGFADNNSDCDDGDSSANPGQTEICDGTDNDCDGSTDESLTSTFYADADGDGYGNSSFVTEACDAPTGYVSDDNDCDDGDSSTNPGQTEVCDGTDNDCDGSTDEGVTTTFYADTDGDGQGDPTNTTAECSPPTGYVTTALDCDDSDAEISPNGIEVCDGVDNNCDGDIDEADAVDVETWFLDDDEDGYGDETVTTESCTQPSDYVDISGDCDDSDGTINPDGVESCGDSIDSNCDGNDNDGLLGDGSLCAGYSCDDILNDRTETPADGVYWIDPTGGDPYEVYCDMTNQSGGWTLLAIYSNDDSVNWAPTSGYWVYEGEFGDPTDPDTNADAKSQAFDDLPIDEVMIINYPSTIGVVTTTGCIGSNPLLETFQTDSENDSDCAHSCSTATVSSPWTGQSYQDGTLRFRCTDYNGTLYYSNGYIVSSDDNSMITTMANSAYYDYNFGLGAGYGYASSGQMVDWDQTTNDSGDDGDLDQVLLLGR